jgi:hypothetical protein
MKKLHGRSASVYKDENITEPDIIFHPVMNHSAQGVDPFAHIRLAGT